MSYERTTIIAVEDALANACLRCFQITNETIMHCVEDRMNFDKVESLEILMDCLKISKMTADFFLRHSNCARLLTTLTAEVVQRCANFCRNFPYDHHMVRCSYVCDEVVSLCNTIVR